MSDESLWQALTQRFSESHREAVLAHGQAAVKHFSPAGAEHYRRGAEALLNLGRGEAVPLAFLEAMPAVAREVGEDVIAEVHHAAARLASMTSGAVIAEYLATLPLVAQRLADAELFAGYLRFVHQLASHAPRALRFLFSQLDTLLGQLTLGGLRRWAMFGAELHRADMAALEAYFTLRSSESLAKLQQERSGTLFVDVHRRLSAFLRALWGREFWLKPVAAERSEFVPHIEAFVLHVPDAMDAVGSLSGLDVYRALTTHMASHLVFGGGAHDSRGLGSLERAAYEFVEDLRVERCATRQFPGLGQVWARLAEAAYGKAGAEDATSAAARVRAWLIATIRSVYAHWGWGEAPPCDALPASLGAWVQAWAARLDAASAREALDGREAATSLIAAIEAAGVGTPLARDVANLGLLWRDDNRIVWSFDTEALERKVAAMQRRRTQRRIVPLMEFINEVDTETQSDTPDEIWVPATPIYDDDGITFQEKFGTPAREGPFYYDEWDDRAQSYRPDWVSVFECPVSKADPERIDALVAPYVPAQKRLRRIVERLRPQGVQRERKLEDGDELDLTAAVDAMVSARLGLPFDPRITMRHRLLRRDLAVLLLLDLSASTNDTPKGAAHSVLDATRIATALLSEAIERIGDPFAILGFRSDGREDVEMLVIKRFAERYGEAVRARLAGLEGAYSTRMGAALRHAGAWLARRPQKRKLLLLVTDGEPADIDERDPNHLRRDARRAVDELWGQGIYTYCLTLDPGADRYVAQLFGKHYTVVDRVDQLPEKLPRLFAALTR